MLLATFAQEAGSTLGDHQLTFRLAHSVDFCFRKLELTGLSEAAKAAVQTWPRCLFVIAEALHWVRRQ